MKSAFGKVFNAIFNRFTVTAAVIVLQLAYLCVLIFKAGDLSNAVRYTLRGVAIIAAIYIVWRDYNPAYKIGWIILISALPIMGGVLYVLFGNKRPSRGLKKKLDPVENISLAYLEQKEKIEEICRGGRIRGTLKYVSEKGGYPAWTGTESKYFDSGEKYFESFIADLEKAKHFIFLEYFIIKKSRLWDDIFEILERKAGDGVEVRIIYDDIGSINHLPRAFHKKLKKAGIGVVNFNPMRPFLSLVYNNRDHRKICVIDGYIGYTGGVNIGDEYVNRKTRFGHWKDNGVRIRGEGVWSFTVMFLNMWNAFRKTDVRYEPYGPHVWHSEEFDDHGIVQPFSDTPLDEENLSENIYLDIINSAEDYVYIYTPYLIIDSEMETALKLAAKRGVDVRIMTPGIPDKRIVFFFTRSYYGNLIRAGVKIFEYTPGFLHAKTFISDDKIAVVGTVNMDYRSFFLHFECGTLLVDTPCIADIKKDYEKSVAVSREITESLLEDKWFDTTVAAVLRVFSPIV